MNKFRLRIKIIYEDDHETDCGYQCALIRYENMGWEEILSSTGHSGHGGYTIFVKERFWED